jgi:hypothetical protein
MRMSCHADGYAAAASDGTHDRDRTRDNGRATFDCVKRISRNRLAAYLKRIRFENHGLAEDKRAERPFRALLKHVLVV